MFVKFPRENDSSRKINRLINIDTNEFSVVFFHDLRKYFHAGEDEVDNVEVHSDSGDDAIPKPVEFQ